MSTISNFVEFVTQSRCVGGLTFALRAKHILFYAKFSTPPKRKECGWAYCEKVDNPAGFVWWPFDDEHIVWKASACWHFDQKYERRRFGSNIRIRQIVNFQNWIPVTFGLITRRSSEFYDSNTFISDVLPQNKIASQVLSFLLIEANKITGFCFSPQGVLAKAS